jgi:hypothetical protein
MKSGGDEKWKRSGAEDIGKGANYGLEETRIVEDGKWGR